MIQSILVEGGGVKTYRKIITLGPGGVVITELNCCMQIFLKLLD